MTDIEFDLAVRSRRIVTPDGIRSGTICVREEKIHEIRGLEDPVRARTVIDAHDRAVIPGVIDTHVHFRDPGYTDKEDFEHGSRAAAAGGVTTVFDMPNVDPVTTTVPALTAHLANAAQKSIVDFGHNASGVVPENIPDLAEAGATAFKVWMMKDLERSYPHMPGTSVVDRDKLYQIFEQAGESGLPLYVHPHDHDVYEMLVGRAKQRWGMDYRSYARAIRMGDSVVLNLGISTILEIQRSVGNPLHVLHVSSTEGIRLVREAKMQGRPVTAEANPFAMFVSNKWENLERLGPYTLNVWVPDDDSESLWSAVKDGTIDVVASDHSPHTREEKETGWTDMYAAPAGTPFVEHYLQLMLTKVNEGVLSLEQVVDLCCAAPAKLTGYYPKKGAVAPGADADLVILDMDRKVVLSAADSHYKCGWASTEGMEAVGAPVTTILRGQVIMEEGNVLGKPGQGRLLTPSVMRT